MGADEQPGYILLALLLLAFGIGLGGVIKGYTLDNKWRKEAVEKGHAQYTTKNGEPTWEWKNTGE